MKKVGIIIQNHGGEERRQPSLDSIRRAENDVSSQIFIADESGPVGINNGIRHFLSDKSITHICLINPDVIVSHHWLDSLTADGLDAAGPVTNIAGNEQQIAVDMEIQRDETSHEIVNEFALKRLAAYDGCSYESDMICFAAAVFTRNVAETVGNIDERFENGYFADDDYCRRVRNEGFDIRILRDTYIHNWGYGPLSHILNDENFVIWQKGQGPFEEKWGVKWQPRGWKLLKSCVQDAEFLDANEQGSQWARDMLIKGYAEHFNLLREESPELREEYKVELPFGENVRQMSKKIRRRFSPSLKDENPGRIKRLKEQNVRKLTEAVKAQALESISQSGARSVCVLAPFFDNENSADGYIQRVKAIDERVLDGFYRIYIDLEKPRISPEIQCIDENHLAIWLDPENSAQADALQAIVKNCDMVYVHSILRTMPDILPKDLRKKVLGNKGASIIWDVHGAVPEEYALAGDNPRAQIAGEAEGFLFENARMFIVVTESMKRHLAKKYKKEPEALVITLPVFSAEELRQMDCMREKALREDQPPLAVYAGGLQEWQKIKEMQDLIEKAGDICRYAVFTPKPEEFMRLWGDRKQPAEMRVESRKPHEVLEEYKACHYGFVLRDDIVVNNVACPTKLIEYLRYGIVPVLSTMNIGDFAAMGMEYISATAFGKGDLPDENERLRMAEKNYEVLEILSDAGSVPVVFPLDPPLA